MFVRIILTLAEKAVRLDMASEGSAEGGRSERKMEGGGDRRTCD